MAVALKIAIASKILVIIDKNHVYLLGSHYFIENIVVAFNYARMLLPVI